MPRNDRNHIFKTAKKKKRRDSFGPLKRMRKSVPKAEQENNFHFLVQSGMEKDIEPDTCDHMRHPLLRAEPEVRVYVTSFSYWDNFLLTCTKRKPYLKNQKSDRGGAQHSAVKLTPKEVYSTKKHWLYQSSWWTLAKRQRLTRMTVSTSIDLIT